jgi:hypothetical protein
MTKKDLKKGYKINGSLREPFIFAKNEYFEVFFSSEVLLLC